MTMLKNTGIATILGLGLIAGCTANANSQSHELATDDFSTKGEVCYHSAGDYDGTDVVPPPISISIGAHEMNAVDAMVAAQTEKHDGYARLLGEFVAAQVNIDAGAEIDEEDIDALIQVEDMLVRLDVETNYGPAFEAELVDLIHVVAEVNEGFRIQAPCMSTDNAGVVEVDAPFNNDRPDKYSPRWENVIVDASAEDSAASDDNGFHRPQRPLRPKHWPRLKAERQRRGLR
jgi:hypothetical protein